MLKVLSVSSINEDRHVQGRKKPNLLLFNQNLHAYDLRTLIKQSFPSKLSCNCQLKKEKLTREGLTSNKGKK